MTAMLPRPQKLNSSLHFTTSGNTGLQKAKRKLTGDFFNYNWDENSYQCIKGATFIFLSRKISGGVDQYMESLSILYCSHNLKYFKEKK